MTLKFSLPGIIVGLVLLTFSCNTLTESPAPKATVSSVGVADEGISNREYASRLQQDGWPVEKLNTAATARYLSDTEKNMVLAHNLIRYNPSKFAELYVSEYISYYQDKHFHYPGRNEIILTHEGVKPARELYRELLRAKPLPLFYPSEKLSRAAKSHANYQSRTGQMGHEGQGGMRARIEREGKWETLIGENLAYGSWSGHDAVIGLMIDDGVPGRGHRVNILTPEFRVVGLGQAPHPEFPGGVYVIKYAGGFEDVKLSND